MVLGAKMGLFIIQGSPLEYIWHIFIDNMICICNKRCMHKVIHYTMFSSVILILKTVKELDDS